MLTNLNKLVGHGIALLRMSFFIHQYRLILEKGNFHSVRYFETDEKCPCNLESLKSISEKFHELIGT